MFLLSKQIVRSFSFFFNNPPIKIKHLKNFPIFTKPSNYYKNNLECSDDDFLPKWLSKNVEAAPDNSTTGECGPCGPPGKTSPTAKFKTCPFTLAGPTYKPKQSHNQCVLQARRCFGDAPPGSHDTRLGPAGPASHGGPVIPSPGPMAVTVSGQSPGLSGVGA